MTTDISHVHWLIDRVFTVSYIARQVGSGLCVDICNFKKRSGKPFQMMSV
jgi:hypothetical protein